MNKSDIKIMAGRWLPAAVLLYGHGTSALAMGLGNIDVRSGLGQPLSAQVELYDAPQRLDAGCFRLLQSQNDLPFTPLRANISVQQKPNGHARLQISTYQTLNDPIILLDLVADCENQISRQYTLLLDPPLAEPAVGQLPQSATNTTADQGMRTSIAASTAPTATPESPSRPQPMRTAKRNSKPVVRKQPSQDTMQPPITTETEAVAGPAAAAGPGRLVISGDEYMRPDFFDRPLQLQMSMELQEWPTTDIQALSVDAVSDEMTAMANKLAHLENQMLALQKRNAELEAQRPNTPMDDKTSAWPYYILLMLGIMALIGLAEWLRRRHIQRQMAAEMAIWNELAPEVDHRTLQTTPQIELPSGNQPIDMNIAAASKPDFMATAPLHVPDHVQAGTTVNEDILEQAEVFVAHGRANLAIVLLQDHLADFPDLSPQPWLMLLDLLKRDKEQAAYEAASVECRHHFNVAIPDFDAPLQEDPSSIEDFPHIIERIQQLWNQPDVIPYLDDLIYNRRLEARQGFGRDTYLEILLLRSIAGATMSSGSAASIDSETRLLHVLHEAPAIEIPASVAELDEPLFTEEWTANTLPEDKSQPLEFEFTSKN